MSKETQPSESQAEAQTIELINAKGADIDTMDLWNKVWKTDPARTKHVNQRGGFTAINAQYQIMQATTQWGPYGKAWGVKNTKYFFVQNGSGDPVELILEAIFFYPGGSFEISTDIAYRPGNDCRKKILTDLTTKALSKLGFNADVFMGMFEDNKYVNDLKAGKNPFEQPRAVMTYDAWEFKFRAGAQKYIDRGEGPAGVIARVTKNYDIDEKIIGEILKMEPTPESTPETKGDDGK